MTILCVVQSDSGTLNVDEQLAKQTVKPTGVSIYCDNSPAIGIDNRRLRIAENHKELVKAVEEFQPDLVWQIESDCDLPEDCLERLIKDYEKLNNPEFGYVSGIQVGRHGLYCLGAWNNFTPTSFDSVDFQKTGLQRVEATGFYCLLAPREVWLSGQASWQGEPYGPDVVWGRSIKKRKYVDMSLHIGHKVKRGIILPTHVTTCNVHFFKEGDKWNYKQL